jgi:hypothetical protein
MYRTEQQYRIKPVAFGKRSDKKRSVKHSKKKQSRRLNNKKLSKHIYYKNKYSRKI